MIEKKKNFASNGSLYPKYGSIVTHIRSWQMVMDLDHARLATSKSLNAQALRLEEPIDHLWWVLHLKKICYYITVFNAFLETP